MDDYLMPHIMAYSHQPCAINIPADVIERCDSTFDIRNFTHLSLLRSILAIRACGGRYKRAYKTLEEIGIPIPIVVYVVKKICKILGCGNLDTNIPHDDTIRAFEQFLQLQHPETYPMISNKMINNNNNNISNNTTSNMNNSSNNINNQWSNYNYSNDYMSNSNMNNGPYGNHSAHQMSGYFDESENMLLSHPGSAIHSNSGSFHIPNVNNSFSGSNSNNNRGGGGGYHPNNDIPSSHNGGLNPNAASYSYHDPNQYRSQGNDFYNQRSESFRNDSFRNDSFRGDDSIPPYHNPSGYGNSNNYNANNYSNSNIYNNNSGSMTPSYELPPELSYDGESMVSNIFMPQRPVDIHMHILQLLLPEINVDVLLQRDVSLASTSQQQQQRYQSNLSMKSRQLSIAFQPDLQSLCQMFWILSICVFITVCDDRQSIDESLARLYELCQFVGSGNSDLLTMSPVLGVALDVIVQRAVYELSDKIAILPTVPNIISLSQDITNNTTFNTKMESEGNDSIQTEQDSPSRKKDIEILSIASADESGQTSPQPKLSPEVSVTKDVISANTTNTNATSNNNTTSISTFGDGYSNPQQLYDAIHSNSDYAKDLYKCISLMLHSVTDSCIRIESSFLPGHTGNNTPMPPMSSMQGMENNTTTESSSINNNNNNNPSLSRTSSKYGNNLSSDFSGNIYGNTQTCMNSRTQKLAKQLREALAWSSCRDQLPTESNIAFSRMVSTLSSSTANVNTTVTSSSSSSSISESMQGANNNNINSSNNNITPGTSVDSSSIISRTTSDVNELLQMKQKAADQALVQVIASNRAVDILYQDIEQMRKHLYTIFYHISSDQGNNSDFQDTTVDLGGLSGTSLLSCLHGQAQNQSQLKSTSSNNNMSNINSLRSNNMLSQPPVGAYGSANGDVEYTLNVPNFNMKIQSYKNQIIALQNKLNTFNDILRIDTTIENCLKHIKACIKEARNQMNIYCNDLQSYSQIYAKKYYVMNNGPISQGSPYGGRGGGMNRRQDGGSSADITSKIARIRAEMETLCSIGDKLISVMGNNLRSLRSNGIISNNATNSSSSNSSIGNNINNTTSSITTIAGNTGNIGGSSSNGRSTTPLVIDSNPITSDDFDTLAKLPSLLQSRRFISDEISKLTDNETSELKRYLKSTEQILRDSTFPNVKLIVRPKHPGIRFGPLGSLNSSMNNPMSTLNSYNSRSLMDNTSTGMPLSRTIAPPGPQNAYNGLPLSRTLTPPGSGSQGNFQGGYPWAYLVVINDSGVIDPYHQIATLYNTYINYDKSNKVRYYLCSVIHFAKIHALCDPDGGTLSIEGWLVLALHVLLHYDIIPNLHDDNPEIAPTGNVVLPVASSSSAAVVVVDSTIATSSSVITATTSLTTSSVQVTTQGTEYSTSPTTSSTLSNSTSNLTPPPTSDNSANSGSKTTKERSRLEDISLVGLLELFFRYLTEDFDILGSIVTIRGKGEALPKYQWRVDPPVMWRLCIEDPYEKSLDNPSRQLDLGATLTRPGQIQVFKAIRRAAFGINAIIVKDMVDTEKYVRMLFHKDDLLALSRMSGYNGAAVVTTPIYIPDSAWKSKVIHIWTSDRTLHTPVDTSGIVTRHGSNRELIARNASRHDSGNSLLDELLIESFGRRNIGTANTSFTNPSTRASPGNVPGGILSINPYTDDNIRVIEGDYVDSDSDDEGTNGGGAGIGSGGGNSHIQSNNHRSYLNRSNNSLGGSNNFIDTRPGPPSIIVPTSSSMRNDNMPGSPEYRNYNINNNSLGSINEIQNLSPQKRPPVGPSPTTPGTMSRGGSNSNSNSMNIMNNPPYVNSSPNIMNSPNTMGSSNVLGSPNVERPLGGSYGYNRNSSRGMSPASRGVADDISNYHGPFPSPAQPSLYGESYINDNMSYNIGSYSDINNSSNSTNIVIPGPAQGYHGPSDGPYPSPHELGRYGNDSGRYIPENVGYNLSNEGVVNYDSQGNNFGSNVYPSNRNIPPRGPLPGQSPYSNRHMRDNSGTSNNISNNSMITIGSPPKYLPPRDPVESYDDPSNSFYPPVTTRMPPLGRGNINPQSRSGDFSRRHTYNNDYMNESNINVGGSSGVILSGRGAIGGYGNQNDYMGSSIQTVGLGSPNTSYNRDMNSYPPYPLQERELSMGQSFNPNANPYNQPPQMPITPTHNSSRRSPSPHIINTNQYLSASPDYNDRCNSVSNIGVGVGVGNNNSNSGRFHPESSNISPTISPAHRVYPDGSTSSFSFNPSNVNMNSNVNSNMSTNTFGSYSSNITSDEDPISFDHILDRISSDSFSISPTNNNNNNSNSSNSNSNSNNRNSRNLSSRQLTGISSSNSISGVSTNNLAGSGVGFFSSSGSGNTEDNINNNNINNTFSRNNDSFYQPSSSTIIYSNSENPSIIGSPNRSRGNSNAPYPTPNSTIQPNLLPSMSMNPMDGLQSLLNSFDSPQRYRMNNSSVPPGLNINPSGNSTIHQQNQNQSQYPPESSLIDSYSMRSPEIDPTVAAMQGLTEEPIYGGNSSNIINSSNTDMNRNNKNINLSNWLSSSVASILPESFLGEGKQLFK